MVIFIGATVFCIILWLLFTFNGNLWQWDEITAGIVFSIVAGVITKKLAIKEYRSLSPKKWVLLLAYLPRFFYEMAKANFDVAYRVITGKIKPGIVKISPKLKNDLSLTILANSITLTPGTLSVDVDEHRNLYVHWINVNPEFFETKNEKYKCRYVCSTFPDWARRMGE